VERGRVWIVQHNPAPELRKIARLVVEHEDLCVEAWNEHFGS
jgi:hypothetical protein